MGASGGHKIKVAHEHYRASHISAPHARLRVSKNQSDTWAPYNAPKRVHANNVTTILLRVWENECDLCKPQSFGRLRGKPARQMDAATSHHRTNTGYIFILKTLHFDATAAK